MSSIRIDFGVVRRRVGRHLSEKLIQGFASCGKADPVLNFGHQSHAKLSEKEAFVGSSGDLTSYGTSAGLAAARLIHQIDRVAVGEKNVLKPSRPSGVVSHVLDD